MKTKTNTKIDLKKLTIAKISLDRMGQINGGDCLPTEHFEDLNSHIQCPSNRQVY